MNNLTLAKIQGKELKELPRDLYIPPDAMLVVLEMFEGPLDLLLYLIRKNNLNIIEIPVASITKQYVEYVENMHFSNLELAADYLEIAAILTEIKSRMLLPSLHPEQDPEEDPRAELIRRLQEYEQIKQAAVNLDHIPRQERDYLIPVLPKLDTGLKYLQPEVTFSELLLSLKQVLIRQDLKGAHTIISENLSVRDKMTHILNILQSLDHKDLGSSSKVERKFFKFSDLFNSTEGKLGIIVTFIAILELVKENVLEILQTENYTPIYIRLINV